MIFLIIFKLLIFPITSFILTTLYLIYLMKLLIGLIKDYNNSPQENFESLFSSHRSYNPYSIVNRSIYNREQYEEEQIQRAIMASLNLNDDELEPEDVD